MRTGGGDGGSGLPGLEAGGGRLEHLIGIRTGGYRLRRDIAFAAEITLLTRAAGVGLQGGLDDMAGVGRAAFVDHAVGDALDALAPIGGSEEIIEHCSH